MSPTLGERAMSSMAQPKSTLLSGSFFAFFDHYAQHTAMNIHVQTFVWTHILLFHGQIPRNGIVGS